MESERVWRPRMEIERVWRPSARRLYGCLFP